MTNNSTQRHRNLALHPVTPAGAQHFHTSLQAINGPLIKRKTGGSLLCDALQNRLDHCRGSNPVHTTKINGTFPQKTGCAGSV